ncbi:MAG: DUF4097 family beta strand repeat protein [Lachnospiraceae bacterium]|nr:DUF4097 family beta strand repeat protein [Lachnospiraceae bacterium]
MNKEQYMKALVEALSSFDEEIKNEIVSDYEEHFDNGLQDGKTEEQIIAELGSIDELVKELNEMKNGKGSERKSGAQGFNFDTQKAAETFAEMAKNFASLIGSMAAGVANGAEKMGDSMSNGAESFAKDFKEGFDNVSEKVVTKTTAFAKEISVSYKENRNAYEEACAKEEPAEDKRNYDESASEVRRVVVDTDNGDVTIKASEDGLFHANYENFGSANQQLSYDFDVYNKDGVQYVTLKRKGGVSNFFKNLLTPKITVDVLVPSVLESISVSNKAGNLYAEKIDASKADFSLMAGDINVSNSECDNINVSAMAGNVKLDELNSKNLFVKSMAGNVRTSGNFENAKITSTAGNIHMDAKVTEKIVTTSTAGNIHIDLRDCKGYKVDFNSTSGRGNFVQGENRISGSRSGVYSFGDGGLDIKCSAVAGNITING